MYGKGQKRSMLIPRLVDSIRAGRSITLTANGGIQINPIHVSDVVKLLDKLIDSSGSFTLNVAGPEILSLKEIADIIGEKLGVKPIYEIKSNIGDNCIANTDLLKDLIYQPAEKFADKIDEVF
jgi:nucleoside-diphosphate-sugar epimerase